MVWISPKTLSVRACALLDQMSLDLFQHMSGKEKDSHELTVNRSSKGDRTNTLLTKAAACVTFTLEDKIRLITML